MLANTDSIASQSHKVHVDGFDVLFPYQPYPDQKLYIDSVIRALNTGKNALLESPTGTGKTLCLLTSTLAWLHRQREKSEYSSSKCPTRIIYTSRTHSQLKQVMKELKGVCYQPVVALIGSRDQTCINEDLNMYKGHVKNVKCKQAQKKNECKYAEKKNLTSIKDQLVNKRHILDIEELREEGKVRSACPFYAMKQVSEVADVLLMPYNYLTDRDIRQSYVEKIKNSIIIFDEAHNIEKAAEEGASVFISLTEISQALAEIDEVEKTADDFVAEDNNQNSKGMQSGVGMMSKIIYVRNMLKKLEGTFKKKADALDSESHINHADVNRTFKDAACLILGVESSNTENFNLEKLKPMETVPSAFDNSTNLLNQKINADYQSLNTKSLLPFYCMVREIVSEVENNTDNYRMPNGLLNLARVEEFFSVFIDLYRNFTESSLETEWKDIVANHYAINFSLSFMNRECTTLIT